MAKGHIFKIVLLVATVVLAALQGIAEMEEDSVNNILYIDLLLPMDDQSTDIHRKNILRLREDVKRRYFEAPDLRHVGKNAYRFLNAVSDFATHVKPLRETANYRENLFARTMEDNPLIDKAYELALAA